ncbi:hypothetical protein [Streptomyces mutabilis]
MSRPEYAATSSRLREAGSVADSTTTGTRYAPSQDSTRSRYTLMYVS